MKIHVCAHTNTHWHTHILCEIPLAGRARCLNSGGLHHARQWLYIEVIIVGFQAPSSISPLLLFCINRTTGFLFLKCFLAGQPILTAVLEKVAHMFHSSPFWLSPAEKSAKGDGRRDGERETVPSDWEWLKAAGCHTLLVLMTRQNYSVLKTVSWGRPEQEGENAGNEIAIQNQFWQIDVEVSLKSHTSCRLKPSHPPPPPSSVASLYREWPHYFLQKQAFPFTTLIWGAPRIPLKRRSVWRPFRDRHCSTWIVNVPTGGVQWLWAACGGVVKINVWLWALWFAIWTAWEEKLAPLQNCHFLCSSTALALEDIWGFF